MTLEQADNIRELLNHRDTLLSELRELEECSSVSGHINDGVNGLGFAWGRHSRQVKYLIDGITADIYTIEQRIKSIRVTAEDIQEVMNESKVKDNI